MPKITEKYLLKNGYEKRKTQFGDTDVFWKKLGHLEIYIHAKNWALGLYHGGDDIYIRDFETTSELKLFEKAISFKSALKHVLKSK